MAAAARQDVPRRPRGGPHRLGRGDQGRSRGREPLWRLARTHAARPRRPAADDRRRAARAHPAPRAPAGLRLHAGGHQAPDGADGDHGSGSRGLDGHGHADLGALVQVEAPLHLLQAELRPGHEPADRSDPRGARDEPRLVHRAAAEPVRPRRPVGEEAPRGASADPDQRRSREDPRHLGGGREPLPDRDARHHLSGRPRRGGPAAGARTALREGRDLGAPGAAQHPDPVGPAGGAGAHRDPRPARDRGGASPPHPQGVAHLGRSRRRDRRGPRGAPLLLPRRLRRGGDQPLPRLRDHAEPACARRPAQGGRRRRGREALHQVDRQGRAQGDVQDGHLDLPVLLRRPDLRRRRPVEGLRRHVFLRHRHDHRGRRRRRDRRGDRAPPPRGLRRRSRAARHARGRRRIHAAAQGRGPRLDARGGREPAARRARQPARQVPRVRGRV